VNRIIIHTILETAEVFGFIKYNLKKVGPPLPVNDVWIAAQGIETGSVILTFDSHFSQIPGLRILGNNG
jgi:tRNA(fMet)-specific endonuclease VapC